MRPETTLFNLVSVDGKICTGPSSIFDFDDDLPRIPGVSEGLQQYYDIEKETDIWALSSGVTMQKMATIHPQIAEQLPVNMVVVDTSHLGDDGLQWLSKKYRQVIVATLVKHHDADSMGLANVTVLHYNARLSDMLRRLREDYGCDSITFGVGGNLADSLFKEELVDHLNIVVAPVIIGGAHTPSLVDGRGVESFTNLSRVPVLRLIEVKPLRENYLQLLYDVVKPYITITQMQLM